MDQTTINELNSYFLSKKGGGVDGFIKPAVDDTHDLGAADQRWRTIYATSVVAGSITGGSVDSATDADRVDGFDAAQNPIPGYLLALDPQGTYPISVYPEAILKDGSRALEGSLTVVAGALIDAVDIGAHNHSGAAGMGTQMGHALLTGLDADDHPQYAQRGQDEIITGDWAFTDLVDRTKGWQFLAEEYKFVALAHSLFMEATTSYARIALGALVATEYGITLFDDTTNTYIKVGRGDDVIMLSSTDAAYLLWAGDAIAADAPFSVAKDGSIYSIAGEIAGWTISAASLESNLLSLQSAGRIVAGSGNDIIYLDSQDATWRLWAGNATASSAAFRVSKTGRAYFADAYVVGTLRSTNFVSGTSGFSMNSDGTAEFDNIIARGRLTAYVLAEATISVASGRTIISDGAVLAVDMSNTDDFIIFDAPAFEASDIIRLKPDINRDEWMLVSSAPIIVAEGFKYFVVRSLNSAEVGYVQSAFYAGENAARFGSASETGSGAPLSAGEEGQELGEFQPGGPNLATSGGYLILEGGRAWGPYFGVVRRYGPLYDQLLDVVRIGNLSGILDYTTEIYGAVFGDSNDFMSYDPTNGLRISTRSGVTTINQAGMATDVFSLIQEDTVPDYLDNHMNLWNDYASSGHRLKVRSKFGADELTTEVMLGYLGDLPIVTVTGDHTATLYNCTILVSCSSVNITINLPAAASCARHVYHIKKIDATGYTVIIDPNGSELVDGVSTNTISAAMATVSVQSDGSGWFTI